MRLGSTPVTIWSMAFAPIDPVQGWHYSADLIKLEGYKHLRNYTEINVSKGLTNILTISNFKMKVNYQTLPCPMVQVKFKSIGGLIIYNRKLSGIKLFGL